jgi:hypothetical protein
MFNVVIPKKQRMKKLEHHTNAYCVSFNCFSTWSNNINLEKELPTLPPELSHQFRPYNYNQREQIRIFRKNSQTCSREKLSRSEQEVIQQHQKFPKKQNSLRSLILI